MKELLLKLTRTGKRKWMSYCNLINICFISSSLKISAVICESSGNQFAESRVIVYESYIIVCSRCSCWNSKLIPIINCNLLLFNIKHLIKLHVCASKLVSLLRVHHRYEVATVLHKKIFAISDTPNHRRLYCRVVLSHFWILFF